MNLSVLISMFAFQNVYVQVSFYLSFAPLLRKHLISPNYLQSWNIYRIFLKHFWKIFVTFLQIFWNIYAVRKWAGQCGYSHLYFACLLYNLYVLYLFRPQPDSWMSPITEPWCVSFSLSLHSRICIFIVIRVSCFRDFSEKSMQCNVYFL